MGPRVQREVARLARGTPLAVRVAEGYSRNRRVVAPTRPAALLYEVLRVTRPFCAARQCANRQYMFASVCLANHICYKPEEPDRCRYGACTRVFIFVAAASKGVVEAMAVEARVGIRKDPSCR